MRHDMEALLVSKLADDNIDVATKLPNDTSVPWVLVTQLNAIDVTRSQVWVDHVVEYMMQLDCYAGSRGGSVAAFSLTGDVIRSLRSLQGTEYRLAVVSRVSLLSMPRIPDPGFQPSRERYVMTVSVRAR